MNEDRSGDLESWQYTTLLIIGWTINITVTVSSFIFLRSFSKLREKSSVLYMISILVVANLLFPLTTMLIEPFIETDYKVLLPFGVGFYRFSLCWSAALALFSYMILVKGKTLDIKYFMKRALICCLCYSLLCPLVLAFKLFEVTIIRLGPGFSTSGFPHNSGLTNQLLGWFFYDIIGTLSPALVMYYCYLKLQHILRTIYGSMLSHIEYSSLRMNIYVAIPIICFLPWIIMDFVYIFVDGPFPFWAVLIACTLRDSWGFLNLLAYWFLGNNKDERFDPESENGVNQTLFDH